VFILKKFYCNCGAKIFFENNQCVSCHSELAWCPSCDTLRSLVRDEAGQYFCSEPSCSLPLIKCFNNEVEHVCNRSIVNTGADITHPVFCDYCRFNETIPDLSDEHNHKKWHRIEIAKRRVFYTLDLLGLPYGNARDNVEPPLSFDFKGDVIPKHNFWRWMQNNERVYTGHSKGKVTINIKEADDVEREKARVSFEEAHRTIIGHFRHEMGHYFWDLLVLGQCEEACIEVYGNHNDPDYATAMDLYYKDGPKPGWESNYISAYATMHPWEDFAECFATYMDMVSVLDIANNEFPDNPVDPTQASLPEMAEKYAELGVLFNEINRAMGLIDLVPEVFTAGVLYKIQFIHNLLRNAANKRVTF
jgi:hypothetical protein